MIGEHRLGSLRPNCAGAVHSYVSDIICALGGSLWLWGIPRVGDGDMWEKTRGNPAPLLELQHYLFDKQRRENWREVYGVEC